MYITRKGQYALFFMIDLALQEGKTVTIKNVANKYDLSEKFMEQVAGKLKNAGIVRVIRGSRGGYYLDESCKDYSVLKILTVIEGERNTVDINAGQVSDNNRTMNSIVFQLGQEVDSAVGKVLEDRKLCDLVKEFKESESFTYVI